VDHGNRSRGCDLVYQPRESRPDTYPGDTPTLPVLLPNVKSMSNRLGCGLESLISFTPRSLESLIVGNPFDPESRTYHLEGPPQVPEAPVGIPLD